jgi:hypothetical protein
MTWLRGAGGPGDSNMNNYSIVRIGNAYVVQAGENRILKTGSRRGATRIVTRATELLASQSAPPLSPASDTAASNARDPQGHT